MPLETGTRIGDLNPLWPLGTDPKSQGDDHIRLVKNVLVETLGELGDETLAEWLAPLLAEKLDLSGGTMTGALTLRSDDDTTPFADDEAVPKRYVDATRGAFHDDTRAASWRLDGNTLECWGTVDTGPTGVYLVTFPKVYARPPTVTVTSPHYPSFAGPGHVWTPATATQVEIGSSELQTGGGRPNALTEWYAIGEWDGVS